MESMLVLESDHMLNYLLKVYAMEKFNHKRQSGIPGKLATIINESPFGTTLQFSYGSYKHCV